MPNVDESRELNVPRVDTHAFLVDDRIAVLPLAHDHGALRSCPRVGPAWGGARDQLEGTSVLERFLREVVEPVLVAMDPRGGDHGVEEAPAQPHRAVQATVLVEGEEGLGVGLATCA